MKKLPLMLWFFITPLKLFVFISPTVVQTEVHIKNNSYDNLTHPCAIHEMFQSDWSKLIVCLIIDNIIDTST